MMFGAGKRVVLTGTWFDHGYTISNGEKYHTGIAATNPTWKVDGAWPADSGKRRHWSGAESQQESAFELAA